MSGKITTWSSHDHWAVAIAFGRSDHPWWRRVINHNAYPREVLIESILRYVGQSGLEVQTSISD
ncbi:MAG: hypothetical protein L7F78_17520 [Syntrophales bacterium LBB04]|nr:hypothetical protein [Syntrophales bacterium LBB04]